MRIRVRAPGTCGELMQGTIDGAPFLVTCPIDLYAEATVDPSFDGWSGLGLKAQAAARKTIEYLELGGFSCGIRLLSRLPHGKGMASSSADIAAVCQALAAASGKILSPEEIAMLAAAIEPTDGVFYSGIVRLNHITGQFNEMLGEAPPIEIAVFDTGGEIDTLKFNQRVDLAELNRFNEADSKTAFALLRDGIRERDAALVGRAATMSARTNQKILCKPRLEEIIALTASFGAVGVNVAHSGTVVGILFDARRAQRIDDCIRRLSNTFDFLQLICKARLISGGLQMEGEKDAAV